MIEIKECTLDDVSLLANMNQLLIIDEKAENTMDLPQLEGRMADFLMSEYSAFFFLSESAIIGYALCNMNKSPIYLRQFFIGREERRKGYGTQAFQCLLAYLKANELDIDVYVWNRAGIHFWDTLGFEQRFINMRYKNPDYR